MASLRVHNQMVDLVREVLERQLAEWESVCQCQKCFDDRVAYALNRLDPLYEASEDAAALTLERLDKDRVYTIIAVCTEALERIQDQPRHDAAASGLALYNYTENLVSTMINAVAQEMGNVCTCDTCLDQVAAHALDQLPPKYAVSHKGQQYVRLDELDHKLRNAVLTAVCSGFVAVRKRGDCSFYAAK